MSRVLSVLLLLFGFAIMGFSQETEVAQEQEPATIQLPFAVEMAKPIKFSIKYTEKIGEVSFVVSEETLITPLRADGEAVIYKAESKSAAVESSQGLPPGLDALMQELIKLSSGLTYEYSADHTGYPDALIESEEIKKFMKEMVNSLNGWYDEFAKAEGMSEQEKAQFQEVLDQSTAPFLTEDNEALSRLVLDEGMLIFAGTGRELYLGHQTIFVNTRFFEAGEIYMYVQDLWQVDEQDEEAGTVSISMSSSLHPEEFPKFIEELKAGLQGEYSDVETTYIVGVWNKMKLDRSASYVIDMKTGLPISGQITSEVFFEGESESQVIEFSSTY